MNRKRVLSVLGTAGVIAGAGGLLPIPTANADALPNGYSVSCRPNGANQVLCDVSGCPRVREQYAGDVVHIKINGGEQAEVGKPCDATIPYTVNLPSDQGFNLAIQGCRKKTLEGDWCGAWSDYKFAPAPKPVEQAKCPPGSKTPTVPAGQQCEAKPVVKVKCPEGSPTPEVEEGQQCAAVADVTNAIQASINPGFGKVTVRVTNSSKLNAKCTYDATPFDTHRDFNVNANSNTTLTFNGINTLTTYHVVISCHDASGKQSAELGHVEQDVTF